MGSTIKTPFAKSNNISELKKNIRSTKIDARRKVIIIWLARFVTLFFFVIGSNALEGTEPPPTPIAISNEEIKMLSGSTTVAIAAIAEELSIAQQIWWW
jgi:hypothetical protein